MSLLNRKSGSPQPSGQKVSREFTIENRLGLHARPSARFVKVTTRYKSEIWVEKDGEKVNGKSIMGLMMLAAGIGSTIRITGDGPQAEAAVTALCDLVADKFGEEE